VTRPPSIRVLFGALLAVVMLLAAGLFSVTLLQSQTATQRTAAEHERVNSFLLSDQMRQSSNDLTEMVRLYVTTGDTRYRRYYNRILAIRNGTAPRPVNYDSSFWDRVLADPSAPIRTGPPASLTELMRRAGFTPQEFRALNASLNASNELALLEERVMNAVAREIVLHGTGRAYLAAVEPEYHRLVDATYFGQKKTIMGAIGRFTTLVDDHAAAREAALESSTTTLLVAQTVILLLLGIILLATLALAARLIGRPLARLTSVTRRIARGDWSERAPAGGVAELRHLAENFDAMADAVQNDLTARRRAERAAESADRAKSAFLAMTSHELRTPLVAVTGTLELLEHGRLDARERELVEVASRSAQTLLGVIGDVLDFSKIEAGHLDLTPVPTAVGALAEDVVAQHRLAGMRSSRSSVELIASVDPRLAPRHEVDAVRLRQVLGNLVGNAIKFTAAGRIELLVAVLDGGESGAQRLALTVADSGAGISAEDQARLFAPFEQARSDVDAQRAGTGLGLVICRQLIEAMGGTIELTSELGRGTTVRAELTLPIAFSVSAAPGITESASAPTRRPLPSRSEAEREGTLVLLVEDHPVNREVLRQQLEMIGFVTDTAADASEALERYERERYGLVFTDVQLPGADGHELARSLRALETRLGRARRPVIALTANALRGERERCIEAGMDDLVVKPATLATLAAALRRWFPEEVWTGAAGVAAGGELSALDSGGELSALEELTGGDAELGREIVGRYLRSLEQELADLAEAEAAGDLDRVRRHAHRIAGASRTVGAHTVAVAASRLEREARHGHDVDELGPLCAALRAAASQPAMV
jgi:signal transduction histidine kinase/CheY-like chemotaxis protein/HPt (histidine-containing phosphotransfer) domain-containing protein